MAKKKKEYIEDEAEALSELKKVMQCVLWQTCEQLAQYNFESEYKNFAITHGNPATLVTNLTGKKGINPFMNITPFEYAQIVPQIRIFKVFYDSEGNESDNIELPFNEFLDPNDLNQITSSAINRGTGVGLRSFTWKYVGTNPAESTRVIEAKLNLRFQSINDLMVSRRVGDRSVSFIELIMPPKKFIEEASPGEAADVLSKFNPNYFTFKVMVGWSTPKHLDDNLKQAILKLRNTLVLTVTNHEIDFMQEGPVNLIVSAQAYIDSVLGAPETDIFAIYDESNAMATTEEAQADLAQNRRQRADAESCNKEKSEIKLMDEEIEKKEESLEQEKIKIYSNILQKIMSSNKLFCAEVPNEQIAVKRTKTGFQNFLGREATVKIGAPTEEESLMNTRPDVVVTRAESATIALNQTVTGFAGLPIERAKTIAGNLAEIAKTRNFALSNSVGDKKTKIYFFFLGDLLESALTNLSGESSIYKDIKIIVGDIIFYDPFTGKKVSMNLADLPVSTHLFVDWFLDTVYAKQRQRYPIRDFIQDVTEKLVVESLRSCLDYKGNVKISLSHVTMPKKNGMPILKEGCRMLIDSPLECEFSEPKKGDLTSYYILYASSTDTRGLNQNEEQDLEKGIYHLSLGKDRGVTKAINYSRIDGPYQRESRIFAAEQNANSQFNRLREVYQASVPLIGVTTFHPGQLVYLNPSTITYGSSDKTASIGNLLGISGYFQVITVENTIKPGSYETVLDTKWVASGVEDFDSRYYSNKEPNKCSDGETKRTIVPPDVTSQAEIIAPPNIKKGEC